MNPRKQLALRLYVAGGSPNSLKALANLRALAARLPPGYHLEVVDVFEHPEQAERDGVLVTPTLLKLSPAPLGRIVGTLTNPELVLHALGVTTE